MNQEKSEGKQTERCLD